MKVAEEKKYEGLSPFELKNKLIQIAKTDTERMMLNAGRGNPNWVAVTPRQAFFQLGLFAIKESERLSHGPDLGGTPSKEGVAKRFKEFLSKHTKTTSIKFLKDFVPD